MRTHAPAAPTLARSIWPLAVLALSMAAGFTALGSFSTVQEGAKAELGLSDQLLATIQGVAVAVPLAVLSIPIGILVDRWNRARLLVGLAACWTAGTMLTAWAPGVAVLFAARMLTGVGATGAVTAALSLGADLCGFRERGRAMMVVTLGKTAGIALAFALVGALSGMAALRATGLGPWRVAHLALGVICLMCLLPLLTLREPMRREVEAAIGPPFATVMRELWRRRGWLLPLFVGQVSVVMADNAALIWAAPVLGRVHHLRPDQFAGWIGALILGTGLGGAILGGFAADWGQRRGDRHGVLRGALVAAVIGAPAALFPLCDDVRLFAVLLGVLTLAGTVTGLVTSVALTVLLPNEVRGVSIGAFIAMAGVIGFGVAPPLVTWISTALGGEAHLAPALAIVGLGTGIAAIAGFATAIRNLSESS